MKINRRMFISICACLLPMANKDAWSWPVDKKCSNSKFKKVTSAGCMLNDAVELGHLSDLNFKIYYGNNFSDTQNVNITLYLGKYKDFVAQLLGVNPNIFFYDDSNAANAYAFTVSIDGSCDVDGSVVIGETLVAEENMTHGFQAGSSLAVIVSHEVSHILQYKKELVLSSFRKELHADYMAGWVIYKFNEYKKGNVVDVNVAAQTLFDKGSYRFNDPTFHGTPEQRVFSMVSGYNMAALGSDVETAYHSGLKFVGNI